MSRSLSKKKDFKGLSLKEKIKSYFKIMVISYKNPWRQRWDYLPMFLSIHQAIVVPFKLSYNFIYPVSILID